MIDFTQIAKTNSFRAYGGANGVKKGIIFNGKQYMLKISIILKERKNTFRLHKINTEGV